MIESIDDTSNLAKFESVTELKFDVLLWLQLFRLSSVLCCFFES